MLLLNLPFHFFTISIKPAIPLNSEGCPVKVLFCVKESGQFYYLIQIMQTGENWIRLQMPVNKSITRDGTHYG